MMQSMRQLREELAWLSVQLEAARDLEHPAEKRHSDEDMAETEAALQGRREVVLGLRERRTRLVKELDRRAVAEKGWEPDRNQGGEALPGTGRAGRLRIGPHPATRAGLCDLRPGAGNSSVGEKGPDANPGRGADARARRPVGSRAAGPRPLARA